MTSYIPGAVASLIATKDETQGKKNTKLLALFSTQKHKVVALRPVEKRTNEQKTKKGKRKSVDSSLGPPSAKKIKVKNVMDEKAQQKLKKTGVIPEENAKPVDREAQRDNRKKRTKDPEKDKRTIFVGNLTNKITKKHLTAFFKKHGTIESVRFRSAAPSDPKLPKKAVMNTKSFHPDLEGMNGYIVFTEIESAKNALESNGELLEGRYIRVDLVRTRKKHDNERSVFVGNVPFDADEEDLRDHFSDCGKIENIRIVRDRQTGLGKGFCYILFADKDGTSFALKLNGSIFKKRVLRIQVSEDMNARGKKRKKVVTGKAASKSTSKKQDEKKEKKKTFSRNMPSNVKISDYQGVKAKRIEKIKKCRKQKKSIKKQKSGILGSSQETSQLKQGTTISKGGPGPKSADPQRKTEKKMRKSKFSVTKY